MMSLISYMGDCNMSILYAFYYALHFVIAFLGLIIAIHTDMVWLGLSLSVIFVVKFLYMTNNNN
jgi:hypothetical protein